MEPRIWLIAGPTASGKSALALRLARQVGGEIVNADALQLYRDLRVLTARPSAEEEGQAPHHLFGRVDAAELRMFRILRRRGHDLRPLPVEVDQVLGDTEGLPTRAQLNEAGL